MVGINIGEPWSDSELEAFFHACVQFGQDFESIRKYDGIINRTASNCRNLFGFHEDFFNSNLPIPGKKVTEKAMKRLTDNFIQEHRKIFGPSTPSQRITRQTASSSRKRKLQSPQLQDEIIEGRRTLRSANRKLTYTSLNEDEMQKEAMNRAESENEDVEKTPSRRSRPRSTPKSQKTTPSTRKAKTSSTALQSPNNQRQLFHRKKSSIPVKIPRKTKTELQKLPYDLNPLPNDSLPPTPNGSSRRGDFSRNSQLPLKLRKIGTHSTVPNIIKIQSLSRDIDEETQNRIQIRAEQFGKLLASNGRRFCACEWFYPTIDCGYFIKNEFMEELRKMNLTHIEKMTRDEWNVVRSSMGSPRRLSPNFLASEREKLHAYRDIVRKFYNDTEEDRPHLYIFPQQLKVDEDVIVLHPHTNYVHNAKILNVVDNHSYKVWIHDVTKPYEIIVPDTHVMQTGPISVNVSKRRFEAISASPNMLFYPGGETKHPKRQRINANGDYRSPTPQNPPSIQSGPHRTSVTANLFSQPANGPKLNLPNNLSSNIDFNSMARTILNLERKKKLLDEISGQLNKPSNSGGDKKIAEQVLEIREIDKELKQSMETLPSRTAVDFDDATPSISSDNDSQKMTHSSFEENRKRASDLINALIREMENETGRDVNVSSSAMDPIITLASDCLAFLLHLQTCVQNIHFTSEDVELTLKAGLMALKPHSESRQDIAIVYEELSSIVAQIQRVILSSHFDTEE